VLFAPIAMVDPGAPPDQVIAAIDVGTNSIHMVVARVHPALPAYTVVARDKHMVRLGEYCQRTGWLTPEAMVRALDALQRCKAMAEAFGAEQILAVATSAVREAPNGPEFLQQVQRVVGLHVDLISGLEEARRIYLGVLSAIEFGGQRRVVIDIGGGSTELVLGDGHEPLFLASIKAGAVRLTEQYVHSDPPSPRDFTNLRNQVQSLLEPAIEELRAVAPCAQLVGTSGTIAALAELDARQRGLTPASLQGYELSFESVTRLVEQLRTLDLEGRRRLAGISERRADIVVAGAVILCEAMALLGIPTLTFCEAALREGLLVDWMLSHGLIADRLRFQGSVRQRSVTQLAQKFRVDLPHAEQVTRLALALFEQTRGELHGWSLQDRELLWAAAMLHNCGHFVNHSSHHKHSYYLIRHGGLLGFTEEEIEVIANIARYHRKSAPKRKHLAFQQLPKEHKRLVRQMSVLLRLASALDRRHKAAVAEVRCVVLPNEVQLLATPHDPGDPCEIELWNAELKKGEFEQEFGRPLTLQLVSAPLSLAAAAV
jgi:exopolyphosphatase/guanosine-5'-triphosphate,3'-diphosphate pyrophosphatase